MWASGWLASRRKAAKVFLGLDFNFQVLVEGEAEESDFDDEADPMVHLDAPALFLSLLNLMLRLLRRPALLPQLLVLHPLTYMLLGALIQTSRLSPVVYAHFVNF